MPAAKRPEYKVALSISLSASPRSLINRSRCSPHVGSRPLHMPFVPRSLIPVALPFLLAVIHDVAITAPPALRIELSRVSATPFVEGSDNMVPCPKVVEALEKVSL